MYHVNAQGVDERMINIQSYYRDYDDDNEDDDDDDDYDNNDAYRGRLCDFLCPTSLRLYSPWIFLILFFLRFISKVLSGDGTRK